MEMSDSAPVLLIIEDDFHLASKLVPLAEKAGLTLARTCGRENSCCECERYPARADDPLSSLFKKEGATVVTSGRDCRAMICRGFTEASQVMTSMNESKRKIHSIFLAISHSHLEPDLLLPIRKKKIIEDDFSGNEEAAIHYFQRWQGIYILQAIRRFYGEPKVTLLGSLEGLDHAELTGVIQEYPNLTLLEKLPENFQLESGGGDLHPESSAGGGAPSFTEIEPCYPEPFRRHLFLVGPGTRPLWITSRAGQGQRSLAAHLRAVCFPRGRLLFAPPFEADAAPQLRMIFGSCAASDPATALLALAGDGILAIRHPERLAPEVQRELARFFLGPLFHPGFGEPSPRVKVLFFSSREPAEWVTQKKLDPCFAAFFDPLVVLAIPPPGSYGDETPALIANLCRRALGHPSLQPLLRSAGGLDSNSLPRVAWQGEGGRPGAFCVVLEQHLIPFFASPLKKFDFFQLGLLFLQTLHHRLCLLASGKSRLVDNCMVVGHTDFEVYLERISSLAMDRDF